MSNRRDTFTVVDIETTGLNVKTDKIIEIGALRIEDGEVVATYHTLLNPGRKLPVHIIELTGITDDMLVNAPIIEQELAKFLEFESTGVLLGHHIIFDYSFLKRAAVNLGEKFERKGIDTLKIARKFLPDLESRSLSNLCKHYGIVCKNHRALADAEATEQLYQIMKAKYCAEDSTVFEEKPLICQVKKESPITKGQKEQISKFLAYHKIEAKYNINTMTRNEASRYYDQLIAKFGRW